MPRISNYTCIPNGTFITHKRSCTTEWIMYKISDTSFKCMNNNKIYPSINALTTDHYKQERPDRGSSNDAWIECKFLADPDTQRWEYIHTLRTIKHIPSVQWHGMIML